MKKKWMVVFFIALLLLIISNIQFRRLSSAKSFMVVSENSIASQIGANILHAGGNAIDAAVAVGYALAVVNPCCGNIGGGGFMTIHFADGKDIFINFREKAPLKASKNMYLDAQGEPIPNASTNGYLAVAIPGTVLGLDTALQKYGTMPRQQVMAPAIQLAQNGFTLTPYEVNQINGYTEAFSKQANVASIFLNHRAGDKLIQPDLANTLKLIATDGPNAFYQGPIAKAIVKASQENGGILSLEDFAKYNVEELTPLYCQYRGYTLISAPPPSSGGVTLCEILNILENYPLNQFGFHTTKSAYYMLEAMRYGFVDRNTKLGDPNFDNNPVAQLISKNYAKEIDAKISPFPQALPQNIPLKHEHLNTTHYSIIDSKGNAVAVTYTLNGFFGAKVIADHTGFFLNNEMDDFSIKSNVANKFGLIQNDANSIQAGKRPLSSMSPTIILKNSRVYMVIGSPGGPRIITAVLQAIVNVIDYGMNIQDAVDAPRFHFQVMPNMVYVEPYTFSSATSKQLEQIGYHLKLQPAWSAVETILIDPLNGNIYGANDRRRPDGGAIGE